MRLSLSTMAGRYQLQAELLDAIKRVSANRRTPVDIRPFWRGKGIKPSQRNAVIDPLIRSHEVYVPEKTSSDLAGLEFVTDLLNFAFYRPPSHLVLTDRTWELMVQQGLDGRGIVIERVGTLNWQSQSTNGGDIINSPQAGRDADVQADNFHKKIPQGISVDQLTDLVAALRADARNMEDQDDRARVRSLAEKLEDESGSENPDQDKVEGMVARATRYASDTAGLMVVTGKLLETWRDLHL